jgi:hypothetical protein
MTLYVKNPDGTFSQVDPAVEASLRADSTNLFINDSGHDLLMPADQAAALKATWAANTAAQQPQQGFAAAIALGVAITSTGTPAVNATYACNPVMMALLQNEALYVLSTGSSSFSNSTSTLNLPDNTGLTHALTPALFMAIYRSLTRYITACRAALIAQTAMPPNTATIP